MGTQAEYDEGAGVLLEGVKAVRRGEDPSPAAAHALSALLRHFQVRERFVICVCVCKISLLIYIYISMKFEV